MAREELVSGLNNAITRGESLESAMASFTTAGYSQEEVLEASKQINMGNAQNVPAAMQQPQPAQNIQAQQPTSLPAISSQQPSQIIEQSQAIPSFVEPKPKRRIPRWLIILISIIGIALVILIVFMFFGPKILDMLYGA